MSNINGIQGSGYISAATDTTSEGQNSAGTGQFGIAMGQVTAANTVNGNALTPSLAQSLMHRSMTTGVPNAELEQYGGYSAVKAMFDANGGSYGLSSIPDSLRRDLAQQVANTGVGNMSLLVSEHVDLAPAALYAMSQNGIDLKFIDKIKQQIQDGLPQKGQAFNDVSGSEVATLTPSIAQSLMHRSMTTGVPNTEMNQYGGYDAVKSMYDNSGGIYSIEAMNADERKALAVQVANTGVGNMSAPVIEKIGVPAFVLKAMANSGIDKATIDQISQKTAAFDTFPFMDSNSYIDTFMKQV